MTELSPVIECRNLVHYYGDKPALKGVSWSLKRGRICALLGRNGAGKTTTINILNSFLTPKSGRCLLFGEDAHALTPGTKARIGYLIEGHVQYGFFDAAQIERFYSAFYPRWSPEIYYHLIGKLDIRPTQKVATMSCGQRSQVALGLILAQQPDLIIFDDYSMGLDPGYRRLFIEVIRDYACDGQRSILLTSHIIQDLEGLVDDVIIYDRGQVLVDLPAHRLLKDYRSFTFSTPPGLQAERDDRALLRIERGEHRSALHGFLDEEAARRELQSRWGEVGDLRQESHSLEDVFIALTGKY